GTTVKHTSPGRILAHQAKFPPLAEQQAIAEILGTLDKKIEVNFCTNATLDAIARALFHNWISLHANGRNETIVQDLVPGRTLLIGDGYRAKNSEFAVDGLPFIRAGNLKAEGLDLAGADVLGARSTEKAGQKIGKPGDIAFTSKGTVGRITRVAHNTG